MSRDGQPYNPTCNSLGGVRPAAGGGGRCTSAARQRSVVSGFADGELPPREWPIVTKREPSVKGHATGSIRKPE